MAIGEEKGKAIGEAMSKETLHKAISVLIRTTSLTDKQMAEELGAKESLVKSIRIELKKKN
jgi:transcription initiation factor IIE alpha subunit